MESVEYTRAVTVQLVQFGADFGLSGRLICLFGWLVNWWVG